MTTVYFIRHAQSDHSSGNEQTRGLSPQGKADVAAVTEFLRDKPVEAAFSSPYQRAIDTIADYAQKHGIPIRTADGFREWYRQKDNSVSFEEACRRHWADLDYRYADGESLREVQRRNVTELEGILAACEGKTVIIGTHGMALSTLIHYYDPTFGYSDFARMLPIMPLAVKMTFDGNRCLQIEQIKIV